MQMIGRLILAACGLVVAAVFFGKSLGYPAAAARMPIIYAFAVGGLSLLLAAQALWSARARAATDEPSSVESAALHAGRVKLIGMILLTLAYVFLLFPLGYVIATLGFMVLGLLWLRRVSIPAAAAGTIVLVAVICLVFIWFLNLPIPLVPTMLAS